MSKAQGRRVSHHRLRAGSGSSFLGLGLIAVALTKIWYLMELHKYVVVREIKRLELQVARMSDRMSKTP